MTGSLPRFLQVIEARFGLRFASSQHPHVERVLKGAAAKARLTVPAWLERLGSLRDDDAQVTELVARLTVNESYFFRHRSQLEAVVDVAVPARRGARGADVPVSILSAGAAGGEELHTIAILLAERQGRGRAELLGVDLNPANVERARAARYTSWALRDTPAETRDRWFRPVGGEYQLDPAIRSMARFEHRNLIEPDPAFWRPGAFDIILCRNVTIYFDVETTRRLLERFARALAPGGFLFLGHSETARGLTDAFELHQGGGAFYYVRPGGEAPAAAPGAWFDAIAGAHARIHTLGTTLPPAASPAPGIPGASATGALATTGASATGALATEALATGGLAAAGALVEPVLPPRPASRADAAPPLPAPFLPSPPLPARPGAHAGPAALALAPLRALLAAERFDDVITRVAELPPDVASCADAQIALAIAATNRGRFDLAAGACAAVLAQDARNPGAHYLLALGAEHRGDVDRAAWHDAAALETDPSFGLARLHLGLLAKRRGDAALARREFEAAHALVQKDDPQRVRLYGGGFSQDALLRMCRMHAPRRAR